MNQTAADRKLDFWEVAAWAWMLAYIVLALLWRYGIWMVLRHGAWSVPDHGPGHGWLQGLQIVSEFGCAALVLLARLPRPAGRAWRVGPALRTLKIAACVMFAITTAYFTRLVWLVSLPCGVATATVVLGVAIRTVLRRLGPAAWMVLALFALGGWFAAADLPVALSNAYPSVYHLTPNLAPAIYIDVGWIAVYFVMLAMFLWVGDQPADKADLASVNGPRSQSSTAGDEVASVAGGVAVAENKVKMRTSHQRNQHAFDHLVGLDAVIEKLVDALELPLREPERLARYKVQPPSCFLLAGPPGTGKTALARAAAEYFGCAFFAIGPGDLVAGTGLVGSSEGRLKELFADARQHRPSVIFFDEIDAIAGRRDGGAMNRPQDLLLRPLLAELDGFDPLEGVLVLAATNVPELLDPALTRSGRFGAPIWVAPPDRGGRAQIWRVYLEGKPLAADVDADELADRSEGWVGADIESAVAQAAMAALKRGMQDAGRDRIEMADLRALLPSPLQVVRVADRRGGRG